MKCSVARCENEVFEVGYCEKCTGLLAKKEEYMPLVCWECGTIVDIYKKNEGIDTIFSSGCRECADQGMEKDTFLVKKVNE